MMTAESTKTSLSKVSSHGLNVYGVTNMSFSCVLSSTKSSSCRYQKRTPCAT